MKRTEPYVGMRVCLLTADDVFGSSGKIVERHRYDSEKGPKRFDRVLVKWNDGRKEWLDPAVLKKDY